MFIFVEGGYYALTSWVVVYPIHWFCMKTMPDCRTDKYRNWYPFTFVVSMIWISFYSYFMVWMITIIGCNYKYEMNYLLQLLTFRIYSWNSRYGNGTYFCCCGCFSSRCFIKYSRNERRVSNKALPVPLCLCESWRRSFGLNQILIYYFPRYGDMAVSNAVGSNVFDILICLGLPWFLKTAIAKPGSTVRVISKGKYQTHFEGIHFNYKV